MPGVTPVAAVGSQFHWGIGCGDLVLGCCQSGAFGGVFAFAADRTFGGVVHREAFREIPRSRSSAARLRHRCPWQSKAIICQCSHRRKYLVSGVFLLRAIRASCNKKKTLSSLETRHSRPEGPQLIRDAGASVEVLRLSLSDRLRMTLSSWRHAPELACGIIVG